MWRRRGSISGGTSSTNTSNGNNSGGSSHANGSIDTGARLSETGGQSSLLGLRSSFFGSDPRAADRPLVFTVDVPTPGPLGLDLRARHVKRDKPQRGAVVKGFRPLQGGRRGFVEESGRVRIGDILQIIHQTYIDDMPFEQIVKHAMQLQSEPEAWPLRLEFRREQTTGDGLDDGDGRPRRSSFFRSSVIGSVPDSSTFNEKLNYFRGFFANKIPTGGAAPKAKEKPPMPTQETVNEMYRELLVKRGVPDDVMDELVRIEPLENKWHVVWYAQQHEIDEPTQSSVVADATRVAESLVELNWDNRGLKDLETLRSKVSTSSSEWVEAFFAHFGLDYLTMKLPDPSPFPVEHSKFEKATKICEVVLRTLRSLTHFTDGVETITNVPGLVMRVALCFHTDNGDLKKHTLQLLGIVCYNSAAGHQAVIEAFDHYKETKGESIRFSCLRDALKSTRYSLAFKEDVLSFVNIIVNKAIRLEDRLAIRSDFMALKMATYFEEIRAKSQAVQRQKFPAFATTNTEAAPAKVDTAPSSPTMRPGAAKDTAVAVSTLGAAVKAQLEASLRTASFTAPTERRASHSSRSAPSSPRERTSSTDFDRFSTTSSRQSIPSFTDDSLGTGSSSMTIISSSVTQLRSQLDNMEKQIEVFERFMEDDRKDAIYEGTDLSSAESVFKSLWESASSDPDLQKCMLSILQQLLFIPSDRVIGKEMWALCEHLMKQVTMLSPVEEVRNYEMGYDDRKTVLRLRDRYTEFLQKCADDDPTFRFHIGPILVIENRKQDPAEDLLLSDPETADETDDEEAYEMIARDHPELIKYFRLLKMGMPMEQVQLKMKSEVTKFDVTILETPGKILATKDDTKPNGIRVSDHEKFVKFFKLQRMGMPLAHIQLKMKADGLDERLLETPDKLLDADGNEWEGESDTSPAGGIPVKDHDKFAKYFKLLKMGMPMEHVKLKASADGLDSGLLDTPDVLLNEEGKVFVATVKAGIPVKDHDKFAKFFKLMKMGMPLEQVKLKASAEGLDASLLDTSDTLLNEDGSVFTGSSVGSKIVGVPAHEHEKYAKFFKLLKMGMPKEHIKLKVSSEDLDPEMLETPDKLLDAEGKEVSATAPADPGVAAKDHEKYAKFFKLLKMGMPLEHIKLKVSSEGLDPSMLDTPDKMLDTDGNEIKPESQGTPVAEHEKFAKFFKLLKMGMPIDHVKLKASAEGLDASLLDKPDTLVDADGKVLAAPVREVKVSEHPLYAKYFKLIKMGMPRPQMELKMAAEGLDAKLLDTPDAMIPETAPEADASSKKPAVPPPPPKPKLRNLYWDTVEKEATSGTIWEEVSPAQAKPEADASPLAALFGAKPVKRDRVLDQYVDKLSEIFVNKPAKAKESSDAKKTQAKKRAPTRVALIDVKRANNIGIMLARFRVPYAKLRDAILQVDKELLTIEKLAALVQFAPEQAELDIVKSYIGNPKLLGDAEQYFREMLAVPRISTRLQAIHATWQFDTYVEEQSRLVESVRNACHEVRQCARLREIFKVVLTLGNALNDGTARGGARGFKLSILLKLNQVKASDNSITLLNYVAQVLRAKDPLILEFNKELPSIESASRVTTQVLKAGESAVRKAATLICDELEEHAKLLPDGDSPADESKHEQEDAPAKDCFQGAIRPFAERAKRLSEQIQLELDALIRGYEETVAFYGEDPGNPENGPDAFFSIFYSFAKLLQTADRDNERRRITEERRIRREEETKKRLEMLKKKKMSSSFASLKDGDVDDIMMKIRAKRVAEKRKELLETSFEDAERLRLSSKSSAPSQTPRSGGTVQPAPSSEPIQPAVEVV